MDTPHFLPAALTAAAIILAPTLSQAKIGETKDLFESRWGKPVGIEEFSPKKTQTEEERQREIQQISQILPGFTFYKNEEWGTVAVYYKSDEIVAQTNPDEHSDADLPDFLKSLFDTSDYDPRGDLNPLLQMAGFKSFVTKDGKLVAVLFPEAGAIVATKDFITTWEQNFASWAFAQAMQQAQTQLETSIAELQPAANPADQADPTKVQYKVGSYSVSRTIGKATASEEATFLSVTITGKNMTHQDLKLGTYETPFRLKQGEYIFKPDIPWSEISREVTEYPELAPLIPKRFTLIFQIPEVLADGKWSISLPYGGVVDLERNP
jgi:hypothetical protein